MYLREQLALKRDLPLGEGSGTSHGICLLLHHLSLKRKNPPPVLSTQVIIRKQRLHLADYTTRVQRTVHNHWRHESILSGKGRQKSICDMRQLPRPQETYSVHLSFVCLVWLIRLLTRKNLPPNPTIWNKLNQKQRQCVKGTTTSKTFKCCNHVPHKFLMLQEMWNGQIYNVQANNESCHVHVLRQLLTPTISGMPHFTTQTQFMHHSQLFLINWQL